MLFPMMLSIAPALFAITQAPGLPSVLDDCRHG